MADDMEVVVIIAKQEREKKKRQAQGIKKTAKRTRMNKEGRAGRGLR